MMDAPSTLLLRAEWGGRRDSIDDCIEMMWKFLRRLAKYGGILAGPWDSLKTPPGAFTTTISTRQSLAEDMRSSCFAGDGTVFGFTRNLGTAREEATARVTILAALSDPEGGPTMVANSVLVEIDGDAQDLQTVLRIGADLVRDAVDVWRPDAASLDSPELVNLGQQTRPGDLLPVIGFCSWLSQTVATPSDLPAAPISTPYADGTLIGIDPGSDNPVEDATELAKSIYGSGTLRPIPSSPEP